MKILIADDDKNFATLLGKILSTVEHEVSSIVTTGGLSVIRAYAHDHPDIVLMDYLMPRINGMSICRHLLSTDRQAKVILMSGLADQPSFEWDAKAAGAVAVLRKPFSTRALQEKLQEISGHPEGILRLSAAAA